MFIFRQVTENKCANVAIAKVPFSFPKKFHYQTNMIPCFFIFVQLNLITKSSNFHWKKFSLYFTFFLHLTSFPPVLISFLKIESSSADAAGTLIYMISWKINHSIRRKTLFIDWISEKLFNNFWKQFLLKHLLMSPFLVWLSKWKLTSVVGDHLIRECYNVNILYQMHGIWQHH